MEKRAPRRPVEGGDDTRAALTWGAQRLEALDVASGPRPELTGDQIRLLIGYMSGLTYEGLGRLAGTSAKQVNFVLRRISALLRMKGRLQTMFAVLAREYVQPEQVVPAGVSRDKVSLPADTVALLTLLASNVSQETAAAKVGISLPQSQYLLLYARVALSAKSSQQAVVIAAVLGIITVPGVPTYEAPGVAAAPPGDEAREPTCG
ncbi:hypothetical protein [Streptomyces sp. FH025]|uniref:hypothetical protein n=1 Tax=Streptomyces sp. FH025 TaxID=2815937 RepID=UPI001A9EF52C|nr:hypothetical protein [Streptomyces sp. FH025]MBO1413227.1 hypothetical protein [Streptomyces sp. FH025]